MLILFLAACRAVDSSAARAVSKGREHLKRREFDKAVEQLTKAIQAEPQLAGAYAYRSSAWMGLGELDRAYADSERAIDLGSRGLPIVKDPSLPLAYVGRATVLYERGDFAKSLNDCDKSLAYGAGAPGHFCRASALLRMGRHDLAATAYQKACDGGLPQACRFVKKMRATGMDKKRGSVFPKRQ